MSITSLTFVLFLGIVFFLYHTVALKSQWVLLLVASGVFYLSFGVDKALYVLVTASTVFLATIQMQRIVDNQKKYFSANKATLSKDEKKVIKKRNQSKRKLIMIVTLLFNLGILCYFKYSNFAMTQLNALLVWLKCGTVNHHFSLIVPLGISFYTFQSIGYLVDVYWENVDAEKNYFKTLLFVSFFPQMTQGPISDYQQLSKQLYSEHQFDYKNFAWGTQRMLWGFFKKMVIADTFAPMVSDVFAHYAKYSGCSVLIGAFLYSIQIYADFSGYMDIMCGFCETLGIRLTENFERPYFSKSIAEYWRRWHISLGEWFKRYIYYPIGMAGWNRSLGEKTLPYFGKHFADTLPATIALVLVWLATGLWHGASWAYITWGLVNGLFIIFSLWMEPIYAVICKKLHIVETNPVWCVFQIVRTFILVTFIKVLPEVGTLSEGCSLLKRIFVNHDIPHGLKAMMPFVDWSLGFGRASFAIAIVGTITMFVVSVIQTKNHARYYFNKIPFLLRVFLLAMLVSIIIGFGVRATWGTKGFMYENF